MQEAGSQIAGGACFIYFARSLITILQFAPAYENLFWAAFFISDLQRCSASIWFSFSLSYSLVSGCPSFLSTRSIQKTKWTNCHHMLQRNRVNMVPVQRRFCRWHRRFRVHGVWEPLEGPNGEGREQGWLICKRNVSAEVVPQGVSDTLLENTVQR